MSRDRRSVPSTDGVGLVSWIEATRLVSSIGSARLVVAIGAVYLGIAVLQVYRVSTAGVALGSVLVDLLLLVVPGLVLVYGGYLFARLDLHEDVRPRAVAWCLGGIALTLGVVGLLVFDPTTEVDRPVRAAKIASALGGVAGLGMGVNEGRALSRAREAEQRNLELRRYEALIEEATDVNAVLGPDGTFEYLTPSVERVLGYEQATLVGESVFEFIHPDDRDEIAEQFARAMEDGRSERAEFRFAHADGSWVVLEGEAQDLLDDPAVEGVVAYTHDVTKRVEAQRRLRQEKERFQSLVEGVEEYAIFGMDPEGRVRTWNSGAETITGYEAGEVLGEHLSTFYVDEDREAGLAAENLAEAASEGSLETEGRRAREDGSTFWASVTITALRDEDGDVRGFSQVTRDMTDRREYERELEQYKTVTDTASNVIVTIDDESVVRSINPAVEEVFGYEPSAVVGEPLTMLMPETARESHRNAIQRYLRTGVRTLDWEFLELPGLHADGHEFPLAVSFSEYEHEGEHYFSGFVRDDTERKSLETDLRATKERYRRLVEQNLVGIYLVQGGEIEYVNPTFAEIFGYTPEEMSEETEPLDHVAPEDRDQVAENLRARLAGEEDAAQYEFTGIRKDGERIELRVHGGRIEYEGEPAVLGTLSDVTEEKRMREQLRRERDLRERILETSPVGIMVTEEGGQVTSLNERGEELLGRTGSELADARDASAMLDVVDESGERFPAEEMPLSHVLRTGEPIYGVEFGITRPDGEELWLSASGAPLLDESGDVERAVLAFEDVTERKEYGDRLVALNELAQDLTEAETETRVADLAVETAGDALGLPLVSVELYDERAGCLRPAARTANLEDRVGDEPLVDGGWDPVWEAFAEQRRKVLADLPGETGLTHAETGLGSAMVFPLGEHGVFVAGDDDVGEFPASDASFARMLVATVRAALDRVDREDRLRDRTASLEEQNVALARVQRVNDTIRGITKDLVEAASREEVLQTVCDRLASPDPYRFVWIGTHDAVTDEVTPDAWAGSGNGFLDAVTVDVTDEDAAEWPTAAAVRERASRVRNDLAADPPFEPWRQAALDRGFRAAVAVPITYQDTLFAVLTVYADDPDAFNEMEEAVLTELGETVGYALNALERKEALVGEQSVELEFRLRGGRPALAELAAEFGCEVAFENVVYRPEGGPGIFFSTRGVDPQEVLAFGERSPNIENLVVVGGAANEDEDESETLFECRLQDSAFVSALLDRGAMPRELTASGDEGHAVVRVPRRSNIRTFVELFETRYDDVELVARREVDAPIKTGDEFESEFRTRLTERQAEVLETAHAAGFFDRPRKASAQDLAEVLDVSQPTVSRHIRAGEQKLFGLLFDEE